MPCLHLSTEAYLYLYNIYWHKANMDQNRTFFFFSRQNRYCDTAYNCNSVGCSQIYLLSSRAVASSIKLVLRRTQRSCASQEDVELLLSLSDSLIRGLGMRPGRLEQPHWGTLEKERRNAFSSNRIWTTFPLNLSRGRGTSADFVYIFLPRRQSSLLQLSFRVKH